MGVGLLELALGAMHHLDALVVARRTLARRLLAEPEVVVVRTVECEQTLFGQKTTQI